MTGSADYLPIDHGPTEGEPVVTQPKYADDRLDWIGRVWRQVAHDYCEHEGVGKSCIRCRGIVSDVSDLFIQQVLH